MKAGTTCPKQGARLMAGAPHPDGSGRAVRDAESPANPGTSAGRPTMSLSWSESIGNADRFSAIGCCRTLRRRCHRSMTDTLQVLDASPAHLPVDGAALARAIDTCLTCVQACTVCADS